MKKINKGKTIIRVKHTEGFSIINNHALRDNRLSLKAKGLHCYCMSLPDTWVLYVSELQKHFRDGRESILSAINELIDLGYMQRKQLRTSQNKFNGYNYTIFEVPQHEKHKP
jgi:hypothetical protein